MPFSFLQNVHFWGIFLFCEKPAQAWQYIRQFKRFFMMIIHFLIIFYVLFLFLLINNISSCIFPFPSIICITFSFAAMFTIQFALTFSTNDEMYLQSPHNLRLHKNKFSNLAENICCIYQYTLYQEL